MSVILSGDRSDFAIESHISKYIDRIGQIGLGYFIIHVQGNVFGIKNDSASILGNSFGAVCRRIEKRGIHVISFGDAAPAATIASAVVNIVYNRGFTKFSLAKEDIEELEKILYVNELIWAPDGDAAFDDGSHVIQIDCQDSVRLIAFNNAESEESTLDSIIDLRISSDEYYQTLANWRDSFSRDWTSFFGVESALQ